MKECKINIAAGGIDMCRGSKQVEGWFTIHACKYPCFIECGSKDYLSHSDGTNLYLNMIDAGHPIYTKQIINIVEKWITDIVRKRVEENNDEAIQIMIHCNQGKSRSQLLRMWISSKMYGTTFEDEESDVIKNDETYQPSESLREEFKKNWPVK